MRMNVTTGTLLTLLLTLTAAYTRAQQLPKDTAAAHADTVVTMKDKKDLSGVTITARKPLFQVKPDKLVVNVANSIMSDGGNALEILERAPGVSIDKDGNISLKGRPGTTIMLNGKLTYLSGQELTQLLRGMASGSIASIEIMSAPSAKYDAAGNSGIINIVLKKQNKAGLNGTVNANGGITRSNRAGGGASLNYRSGKVNLYGSYDYWWRGETELLDFNRKFYQPGSTVADRISQQKTITDEPLHTHNFKTGIDFSPNEKNTFGFLMNGNLGLYSNISETTNKLSVINGRPISDALTDSEDHQRWGSFSYNLNYLHRFNTKGKELSVDVDYSGNSFSSRQSLNTDMIGHGFSSRRRGYSPSNTDVYVIKSDYTQPLGEKAKLEGGIKASYVQSDNKLAYDTLQPGNIWVNDLSTSNHFKYNEIISAAYINFSRDFAKFTLQAGLRGEQTNTKGHQLTIDSMVKRSYFQLFPSVSLSHTLSENHKLLLAYSRRVNRPGYDELNPFRMFRDPYLFYEGNPFLQPELTNTIEFSHTFKGTLITTLNYSHTKDVMNWMTGQVDSINTTFQRPQNLSGFTSYGISFAASVTPVSWWSSSNFLNLFRNEYKDNNLEAVLNNNINAYSFNSQNTIRLPRDFSAELNGYYQSRSNYGAFITEPYGMLSAGVQKLILDKKGTLKLMVNDIFRTKKWEEKSNYAVLDMYKHIRPDSRVLNLSFTYRFGKQFETRERKSGAEDIQNRVRGGG